jgi:hypothetical protein
MGDRRERSNWTLACLLESGMKWMLGMAKRGGYPKPQHLEEKLHAFFSDDDFSGI